MNVTAHQGKEENEETEKGKRGAGEMKEKKRKQATDFKDAVCCPSAVVQGQYSEKMKGSARGTWDPREGQQPFRPNPNGAGDRTTTLRRLLIGAGLFDLTICMPSKDVRMPRSVFSKGTTTNLRLFFHTMPVYISLLCHLMCKKNMSY